jgi:hypothetical protein
MAVPHRNNVAVRAALRPDETTTRPSSGVGRLAQCNPPSSRPRHWLALIGSGPLSFRECGGGLRFASAYELIEPGIGLRGLIQLARPTASLDCLCLTLLTKMHNNL